MLKLLKYLYYVLKFFVTGTWGPSTPPVSVDPQKLTPKGVQEEIDKLEDADRRSALNEEEMISQQKTQIRIKERAKKAYEDAREREADEVERVTLREAARRADEMLQDMKVRLQDIMDRRRVIAADLRILRQILPQLEPGTKLDPETRRNVVKQLHSIILKSEAYQDRLRDEEDSLKEAREDQEIRYKDDPLDSEKKETATESAEEKKADEAKPAAKEENAKAGDAEATEDKNVV